MRQGGTGGAVRQYCRAAHPHLGLGHAADQRGGMQDVGRQVHDADARLGDPLAVYLHGRGHALEYAARHACHAARGRGDGRCQACHEVGHEVVHLAHVRHGHDRGRRRDRGVRVDAHGQVAEFGHRHARHGRKRSCQARLQLVQGGLRGRKKVRKAAHKARTSGSWQT